MESCTGSEKRKRNIVTAGEVVPGTITVDGGEHVTYGVAFQAGEEVFRIEDVSLERQEAKRFLTLVLEAGDVPSYQVCELLEDFLAVGLQG